MQKIILKPSEKLVIDAVASAGGAAIDLTNYIVRSQVRDLDDALKLEVTVTIDPDQTTKRGVHTLSFPRAATADWEEGELVCNVLYEDTQGDGDSFSTETFGIHVQEKGVTR